MKHSNIILATTATTYTEDSLLRVLLARKMFEEAERLDYTVCCVERTIGKVENILFSKMLSNVIRIPSTHKTTGEDRRKAIASAMEIAGNHGFWVWVEPERVDFPRTIPALVEPLLQEKFDLVVPERSNDCWDQLPPTQWMSEKAINRVWEIVTGTKLDIASGPKIGNRRAGHYFLSYQGRFGDIWDSTNCPIQYMISDGLKVTSRNWDFLYPREQIEGESEDKQMQEKRLAQFTNLAEAILSCSLDLKLRLQ